MKEYVTLEVYVNSGGIGDITLLIDDYRVSGKKLNLGQKPYIMKSIRTQEILRSLNISTVGFKFDSKSEVE